MSSRNTRVDDRRRRDRNTRNTRNTKSRRRNEKKHRSCCSSCLIVIVVLIVVTAGALYGGGYFAWKQYAEPKFGISFNDALGLVGGALFVKEKDVVTNPYESGDIDGFYGALSDALFLDDSVNLRESLDDVLQSFVVEMTKGDSSEDNSEHHDESMSTDEESSVKTTTGNEALDNFLKELKFDFSRLKDYEDEYATPNVLTITDKQTAAFLDDTIDLALSSDEMSNKVTSSADILKNVTLKDVVDIPQVIVSKETVHGLDQVALTLTVRVNLRSTVKEVASSIHSMLGAAAILVPKQLYATVTVYPNDALREAKIMVNSMSEKKMNDAYSVANYFLKDSKYGSVNGILQMVNQKAVEAIEKVQSVVPVEFLTTGSVEMHPIKALMNALGATEVTETQFYCMVRDLFLPSFDDVKTTLGFNENTSYEDIETILEAGKQSLVDEITAKYALEPGYLTADNMLDKLKGVGGESSELVEKVHLANLDYSETTYNAEVAKVHMNYVGLAGLLGGYLDNVTSGEGDSTLDFTIINCYYNESSEVLTLVLKLGVLDTVKQKLGTESLFSGLINQLVPKDLYIRANVCLRDGDTSKATMAINNRDVDGTIALLDTIGQLTQSMGASLGLDYDSLTGTVADSVRDGVNNLKEQLGTGLDFKASTVDLPSVYEIMANKILYSDEVSADNLSPAEVYLIFKGVCVIDTKIDGENRAETLTRFIGDVNTKYAIKSESQIDAESSDSIVTQMQALGTSYDTAIQGSVLAANWATAIDGIVDSEKAAVMKENFSPFVKEDEAAKLFEDAFTVETTAVSNVTLNKVIIENASEITLIYSCEYNTDSETKYASVLPDFVINVLVNKDHIPITDPTDPDYKCVRVTINTMDGDTLEDFELMCERLGIAGFSISTIEDNVNSAVKDGLKDLFNKVEITLDAVSEERKIYFGSVFELAYKNVHTNEDYYATDIADTILALHTAVARTGQNNIDTTDDKFDSSTVQVNFVPPTLEVQAELSARNIGAAILDTDMSTTKASMGITADMNLYQVLLINLDDANYEQEDDEVVETLSSMFDDPIAGEFVVATFDISTTGVGYDSTLLPEDIYMTIMISNTDGSVKVGYNNLTEKNMIVMKSLAGGADAFDTSTITTHMQSYIRDVVLFSFTHLTITYDVKLGDVLDGHYGAIIENMNAGKLNGLYHIDYVRSLA